MVTRPRDRFTASPHSMLSTWTSPATCAIHKTAKRLLNNLVNYLPRTLARFSFAFLRDKKTGATICYLQRLRTKLKLVNIGKWLIIQNQPSSRKSHLKYSYHLASNFSAYIFDNFKPPKNLLNLCCRELKGNWDENFKDIWTVDIREWNTWRAQGHSFTTLTPTW